MKRISFLFIPLAFAATLVSASAQEFCTDCRGNCCAGKCSIVWTKDTEACEEFSAAVQAYRDEAAHEKLAISSLIVIQNGQVLAEEYFTQQPDDAHVMWSVSKTFTSFAVGLAIEEGLLSLDSKLCELFPDECEKALKNKRLTQAQKDNLKKGTIKDYLTMSCGQEKDAIETLAKKYHIMDVNKIESTLKRKGKTLTEVFFEIPFDNEPGKINCYNSVASYVLSAAVQKVSGQTVNDYLESRLWEPLGIEKPRWDQVFGTSCGGWGLYLKTRDMAKVGQMMLDRGQFNGRQLVPANYLEQASSPYFSWDRPSWSSPEEGRAYFQGYGYQIWKLADGFSASGMCGQYIMVLPELNAVIACTADLPDDGQKEQNLIFKHLVPALKGYRAL
ncbi:MAG: serine hydrolase domain-containing protein [Candidatus Cryptobacteroides sp.]